MNVLGIDLSSFALDLVLLDENTDEPEWIHLALEGETAFDRCRQVAAVMPSASWFEDKGVYLAAIEKPTAASFISAAAQFPVFGAVAVLLPRDLVVWSYRPAEWKAAVGIPLTEKPTGELMATRVGGAVAGWPQDALDACAVAWAAKQTNARAVGSCHEEIARVA